MFIFEKRKLDTKRDNAVLDLEAAKELRMLPNGGGGAGETLEYGKVQDLVSKYFQKADEVEKLVLKTKNTKIFVS